MYNSIVQTMLRSCGLWSRSRRDAAGGASGDRTMRFSSPLYTLSAASSPLHSNALCVSPLESHRYVLLVWAALLRLRSHATIVAGPLARPDALALCAVRRVSRSSHSTRPAAGLRRLLTRAGLCPHHSGRPDSVAARLRDHPRRSRLSTPCGPIVSGTSGSAVSVCHCRVSALRVTTLLVSKKKKYATPF